LTNATGPWSRAEVNVLSDDKKQQVLALGRLGWTLRDIEEAVEVRRETASRYLKAAGIPVRAPRARRRPPPVGPTEGSTGVAGEDASKPASPEGVSTDSAVEDGAKAASPAAEMSTDLAAEGGPKPASAAEGVSTDSNTAVVPSRAPAASACEPYRNLIEAAVRVGRNAKAIWQDLVSQHGFSAGYASVKRFVRKLVGTRTPEERVVIETAPGREAQVDYGEGPMVRHPETGKYRRTRLFVLTLGFSRKAIRLLVWASSVRIWAELHEQAFRRLGGATATVVLDNLREGVLKPDIYDPQLNPLYRDVLAHYGVVALPCRVRDPDRKGKVESGIGHTQRTPLKGLRFEALEDAQRYLDEWDTRWADTRIHGTTKRQVAAMFADEQPYLRSLPVEPFRYYSYGERIVHLDGCVEVNGAYYHAPPGWIGRTVFVQWDGLRVRLLDKSNGTLLREYLVQRRGGRRVLDKDRPAKTPKSTLHLIGELTRAGRHVAALADRMHRKHGGEDVIRKLQGVRSLVKKYGAASVDEASAALLELGLSDYRSLRRYLERRPAAPLSLAQVDPLIRQLSHYRDLIHQKTQGDEP
jgi:transposase